MLGKFFTFTSTDHRGDRCRHTEDAVMQYCKKAEKLLFVCEDGEELHEI